MKTNNNQLDEQNYTPEEESFYYLSIRMYVIISSHSAFNHSISNCFANKGIIGDKEDFCIKTTSEEKEVKLNGRKERVPRGGETCHIRGTALFPL